MPSQDTRFPSWKIRIEMTKLKKKKKGVCWISEVFTLIILRKLPINTSKNNRLYKILCNVRRIGVNIYSDHLPNSLQWFVSGVPFDLRKVGTHPIPSLLMICCEPTFWTMQEEMNRCFILSQLVLLKLPSLHCFDTMLLCTYRSNLPVMKNKTSTSGLTK